MFNKPLSEVERAEEYYRPGVWKIYYRVVGHDYSYTLKCSNGEVLARESPADEIKFSGHDAEELSLLVYLAMAKNLVVSPDGEMANTTDLKSVGEILAGSSPAPGTKN